MGARRHAARCAAGVAIVGLSACTLFSGWSDLQGGARPSRRDAAEEDEDAMTTGDAAIDALDAMPMPVGPGAPCGATTCAAAEGCCVPNVSGRFCSDQPSCNAQWLSCTERRQCAMRGGTGRACCLNNVETMAVCKDSCSITDTVLCDPQDKSACASNLRCTPLVDTEFHACQ